jgi:hypothetical protein
VTTRAQNRLRLKRELFRALGAACSLCGKRLSVRTLEVHHVDGCTWNQRSVNVEHRLYIYRRELRAGVRLAPACRSCNAARNQATYGTRSERLSG